MFSLKTNSLLTDIPSTPKGVQAMADGDLVPILQELDLDTSGNVSAKRAQLRAYIGLRAEAV
jgi:hypothetical protein